MLLGLGVGYILKLRYDKTTALAIEVGMQNSGLAVTLAATNFALNPLATLVGAIFSVWHNISGAILLCYVERIVYVIYKLNRYKKKPATISCRFFFYILSRTRPMTRPSI